MSTACLDWRSTLAVGHARSDCSFGGAWSRPSRRCAAAPAQVARLPRRARSRRCSAPASTGRRCDPPARSAIRAARPSATPPAADVRSPRHGEQSRMRPCPSVPRIRCSRLCTRVRARSARRLLGLPARGGNREFAGHGNQHRAISGRSASNAAPPCASCELAASGDEQSAALKKWYERRERAATESCSLIRSCSCAWPRIGPRTSRATREVRLPVARAVHGGARAN